MPAAMRGGVSGHPAPTPSPPAGRAGGVSRGRQRERMTESRHPTCPESIGPDTARVASTGPRMVGVAKPALVEEATLVRRCVPIVVTAPSGQPVIVALRSRGARPRRRAEPTVRLAPPRANAAPVCAMRALRLRCRGQLHDEHVDAAWLHNVYDDPAV